jgi:hypothetical protein
MCHDWKKIEMEMKRKGVVETSVYNVLICVVWR